MSDNLLIVTVLAYLVAMCVHAADYAFGRRGAVAKVLVGAGGPPVADQLPVADQPPVAERPMGGPYVVDRPPAAERSRPPLRLGLLALVITCVAALAHLATTVTRSLEADRLPWGNMYEFVLTVTLVGTLVWLTAAIMKPEIIHLGLFVTLSQVLLTGVAMVVLRRPVGPLVPALDSYWFVVHVGTAALASALFMIGFAASVMYLLRSGYDAGKRGGLYPYGRFLANADTVERLSFRMHAFAFPIWTFAVAAGAIWAEAAWGRYWGWDPKETWAFISWIVYAAYLHARATPSIKPRVTAWVAIVGWATMLMNLFGVNLFFEGLHSYGGV